MIFDTHTHLQDSSFDIDREEIIKEFPLKKVFSFTEIGFDLESSKGAITLSKRISSPLHCYASIGFHPDHSHGFGEEEMKALFSLSKEKEVVSIGEIGLDYYYLDKRTESEKKLQKKRRKSWRNCIDLCYKKKRKIAFYKIFFRFVLVGKP